MGLLRLQGTQKDEAKEKRAIYCNIFHLCVCFIAFFFLTKWRRKNMPFFYFTQTNDYKSDTIVAVIAFCIFATTCKDEGNNA